MRLPRSLRFRSGQAARNDNHNWRRFQSLVHRREGIVRAELSRRSFLKRLGLLTGGMLAASRLGPGFLQPKRAGAITADSFYSEGFQRMSFHENPVGPSDAALEAVRETIVEEGDIHRYPDFQYEHLKSKILSYNNAGENLGTENVILGCGSWESLNQVCDAFLTPDSAFLTEWPTYHVILDRARVIGSRIIKVPHTGSPPKPDLAAMRQALADNPDIRLVHFNTINNPIGSYLTRDEFDSFAQYVFTNHPEVVIIADDSDPEFLDPEEKERYPRFLDYVEAGNNLVHIQTFSHGFGLTGLRMGYTIAPPGLIDTISKKSIFANISRASAAAVIASLEDAENQTRRSYENNRDGREYLYQEFDRLGLQYHRSQGSYVIFDTGQDGISVFGMILARQIVLRPGEEWNMSTWVRVCPGLPEENECFISVLEDVLGGTVASAENYLSTPEGKKTARAALGFGMNPYPRRMFPFLWKV